MTLFAVACAGIFPLFHTGRPWLAYWLLPYPEHDGRVAAVPQPADLGRVRRLDVRDRLAAVLVRRADSRPRDASRSIAVARRPDRLRHARDGLARVGAALASATRRRICCSPASRRRSSFRCTPSSASTSRSGSCPGWHTTIFPPYFVAGAIYSGFAMVLTLAIPIRAIYGLKDFITMRHLQNMAKVMLVTGLIVAYGYLIEAFIAWYSGDRLRRLHASQPHDRPVRVGLLGADPLQHRRFRSCCGSSASGRIPRRCS